MINKMSCFKRTNDDWCPSYDNNLVEVTFTQTGPAPQDGKGEWRVCIWGADDFGMEKDFPNSKRIDALLLFYRIVEWKFVDIDELKNHGFKSA